MRIVLYYSGNSKGETQNYDLLMELLEFTEIDMQRVPNKGETITLYLGACRITAEVTHVFPHYCPAGNKYIREGGWGESYGIQLDNAKVVDWYCEQ